MSAFQMAPDRIAAIADAITKRVLCGIDISEMFGQLNNPQQLAPDIVATITDAITRQYNSGYNLTGMSFGERGSAEAILNACKQHAEDPEQYRRDYIKEAHLYRALWRMNREAIHSRYPDDESSDVIPDMPENCETIICHLKYGDQHWVVPAEYYQLLKWIECYLYQCAEGDVPTWPLYKAIQDYCDQLRMFICHNNPAYVNASWS